VVGSDCSEFPRNGRRNGGGAVGGPQLLGLIGGLIGGGAAIGGWTIATRRRVHRVAATV
jgi:hypothetical protein